MDQENKELKILKAQLNAIFQSSYDGMYITDGEGMFLNVNNGLERITGVKKEELIGANARDLFEKGIISRSVVQMVLEEKHNNKTNHNR
jgi:PAS domain S-box-containing protein